MYEAKRDRFLSKLEKLLGRRVRPLPIGRPKKNKKRKKNVRMGPLYLLAMR